MCVKCSALWCFSDLGHSCALFSCRLHTVSSGCKCKYLDCVTGCITILYITTLLPTDKSMFYMNVYSMNVISTYYNPLSCSAEVVGHQSTFRPSFYTTLLSFHILFFCILYSREVCNFGYSFRNCLNLFFFSDLSFFSD